VALEEYVPLTSESCQSLAGQELGQLNGHAIICTMDNLKYARNVAWIDIFNASTWLGIVAIIEIDVWFQLKGMYKGRLMKVSHVLKIIFYSILFVCAIAWGYTGVFLDFADAALWLFAFFFIEMNLFQWQQETEEEVMLAANVGSTETDYVWERIMTEKTRSDWEQMAEGLSISSKAIIGGQAVDAASGKTFDCISPIDGKTLATVAQCGEEDVNRAVAVARKAFDDGVWVNQPPAKRKRTLQRFAEKLAQHKDELALLETLDMGKPIGDSLSVDVPGTVNCIQWSGEAIDKVYDEVAPTGPGEMGMITREPLGVIGAVVPWNFPMMMAAWKLGPALATGNSVVLKPSEKSPLTAIRMAELALEAGIPEGVFNVLPGFGPEAGEPLAAHMDVDGLVFTGSTAIGKHLLSVAALSNMKRTFVECGGKSPNIVFADAPDLDAAAVAAAGAIFFNQGEVCTAASRLLVEESIKDDFIDAVVKAASYWQPSHSLEPGAHMGAMVDATQTSRVLEYVKSGNDEGADLRCGGHRANVTQNGQYVEATVFANVTNDMKIAKEEIFGPVLSCISFKDEDEAVKIANDTEYGLAAAVWTSNFARGHRMARKVRAGSMWVNYWDGGDMTAPFGGFKQSGNGRDKSLHAFDKYTEIKATWMNLSD